MKYQIYTVLTMVHDLINFFNLKLKMFNGLAFRMTAMLPKRRSALDINTTEKDHKKII
jgi:hypothetical protein